MAKIITFDELKNDPSISKVIIDLENKFKGSLPQVVIDSLIDITTWADLIPKQVAQWIKDTAVITNRISTNTANSSDFSILWIRVYEIIEVLPNYFARYEKLNYELDKITDTKMTRHIELGEFIRHLLVNLVQCLTDDELILLEYERNCNSHVFQNGYRVNVKINESQIINQKTNYKGMPISEVNATIDNELKKYNHHDIDFLKAILIRIKPKIDQIANYIDEWST